MSTSKLAQSLPRLRLSSWDRVLRFHLIDEDGPHLIGFYILDRDFGAMRAVMYYDVQAWLGTIPM